MVEKSSDFIFYPVMEVHAISIVRKAVPHVLSTQ